MLRATVITPARGQHIGKTFDVGSDGALVKGDIRMPKGDLASAMAWRDMSAFHSWLTLARHDHMCVTYGTPEPSIRRAVVVHDTMGAKARERMRAEYPEFAGLPDISRSSADLSYRPGGSILSIDNDPTPRQQAAGDIKTPEQVFAELMSVWPQIDGVARVYTESATTHLYIDGKQAVGRKGCRVLLPVALHDGIRPDKGARPYMQILQKRLICAGAYSVFITSNGKLFLRTIIDLAMFRPSQPDFLGAPKLLSDRLSQRRPDPVLVDGREEPLDLRTIMGLTEAEDREYEAIMASETEANAKEIEDTRERWHQQRDEIEFAANGGRVPKAELRRRRIAALDGGKGVLPLSHAIHIDGGGWVTGAQIVSQPSVYADKSCASPTEPEYGAVDGGIGRHKGMIRMRRHEGVLQAHVIDYAHGAMKWYRFSDDLDDATEDLDDDGNAGSAGDEKAASDAPKGRGVDLSADRSGAVVFAESAAAALTIQPPPPEIHRPANFPVVAGSEVSRVAAEIVRADDDGISVVLGQDLELAVARAFFDKPAKGKTVIVRDYDAAHALKGWIERDRPDLMVMVMPGRTADAAKLRTQYGAAFLNYWQGGTVTGQDDVICMKRKAVAELHRAGLGTVSSHTCRRRGRGGDDDVVCQFFDECGKISRLKSKASADIVIETSAALAGQLNPLLEGSDRVSADVLVTDIADRPTSLVMEWPYEYWQQPPLAAFLPFAERRDAPPSYGDAGEGSAAELDAWAGGLHVAPGMSEEAAVAAIADWRRRTGASGKLPTRLETRRAIDEWVAGHAVIRVEASRVRAIIQVPPRRLEDTSSFVLSTTRAARDNMLSRAKVSGAAAAGATTTASKRVLPGKIVQIVPVDRELDVGHWLAKNSVDGHSGGGGDAGADKKLRGGVRDTFELIATMAKMRGPGIVICGKSTVAAKRFEGAGDIQVVDFGDITAVAVGAGLFRRDARWACVLGRYYPSERRIVEFLCSASPEDWPPSVFRDDGLVWYKTRPVFTKRNGEPHPDIGVSFRWTGSDDVTDAAVVAAVTAPVQRVAEWLGSLDPAGSLLVIVDGFPLVSRSSVLDGVPADELLTMSQAVPPASWLMTELHGKTPGEAAAALGVSLRLVYKEVKKADETNYVDALDRFL